MMNGVLKVLAALGLVLTVSTISSCSKKASDSQAASSHAQAPSSPGATRSVPSAPTNIQDQGAAPRGLVAAATSTPGIAPVCSGTACSAVSPTKYSGSGIGIWRYRNTSTADAVIDIDIDGVDPGQSVFALFSNGGQTATKQTPQFPAPDSALQISASPVPGRRVDALLAKLLKARRARDAVHDTMLRQNLDISRKIVQFKASMKDFRIEGSPAPNSRSVVSLSVEGTTRTWIDNFSSPPTSYTAAVEKTCPLVGGRRAVFWIGSKGTSPPSNTDPKIKKQIDALGVLGTAFCGSVGGYQKLVDLIGDPWGASAANYAGFIQDAPSTRLDVNIVVLNVPAETKWGGYFSAANNYFKKSYPTSNEALAFFANATTLTENLPYMLSTLIHEMTHMINFYQRTVVRGQVHGAWLEETSAMMSEDIIAPGIQPPPHYNNIASDRIPGYLDSGGAVSYIGWPLLSVPHYSLGGSFGAFINRRFGISIFKSLVASCSDKDDQSSYTCLDKILRDLGSPGMDDEFARFGATVFAGLDSKGSPPGFGYPSLASDSFTLDPIDISAELDRRPNPATPLQAGFPATAQTYHLDVVPEGEHTYKRTGIVVPAKTDLVVIIK